MKSRVTDYVLYRWRYVIACAIIVALVVIIVAIAALFVPGALRGGEEQSAIQSGTLSVKSMTPDMVVNLPYHLLQRLIFIAFGVSTFTIKLPSVILGVLTLCGVFFLIRTWFRPNIAVIVTFAAVTMVQFLFMLQDGTPNIMFTFLATWLLAIGTYITRAKYFNTFWKVAGCVAMATALYTPLGIYLVIATVTTAFLHPHIRYVIRNVAPTKLALAIILGLLSITPLVYAIVIEPKTALTLLGIPTSSIDLRANLITLGQNLTGFFGATSGYLVQPVFSLSALLLVAIGLYRLFTVRHTAHSYVILILGALMIPLVILEPMHILYLYPLIVLCMAMGIEYIIYSWYRLFPRNPYARVAGLVPLGVFILGMMFAGLSNYMNSYLYDAKVLDNYTTDLRLVQHTLAETKATIDTTTLVVPKDKEGFYTLVAHYDKRFQVDTDYDDPTATTVVLHDVYHATTSRPTSPLETIITNHRAQNADRLYIYKVGAN